MAMQAPAPKKAWFLYLMMERRICRLSIDEFCKRNIPKPRFEVVHDYYPDDEYTPSTTIPLEMQPLVLGSKVYMLGGETRRLTCDPESNDSDDDDSGDSEVNNSEDGYRRDLKSIRRRETSPVPNLDRGGASQWLTLA